MVTVTQLPASSRILPGFISANTRNRNWGKFKNDKHLNFQVGIYCSKPDDGWQDASDMIDGPLARRAVVANALFVLNIVLIFV